MSRNPYAFALLLSGAFACGRPAADATQTTSANAETRNHHRVVIEVSVDGAERWDGVLNNAENVRKALGADKTEVEIVAHGKGLGMLLQKNDADRDRIERLAKEGVKFRACENTMRKQSVQKSDLLPSVETVDSGVAEVVRKSESGWTYLKGGG